MKFYQRRILRVIAIGLVGVAALFAIAHSSWVARFVAGVIEDSTDGRLRIGELHYRLWRGEVGLEDLVWTSPEITAQIPEVEVALSLRGRHLVRVHAPRLQWLGSSSPVAESTTLPALPPARIEITDGSVFLDGLEVTSIDATLEPEGGSLRAGRILVEGHEPASLSGIFVLAGDEIRIEGAELTGYGATARVTATLDFTRNTQTFHTELTDLDLARFDPRLTTRLNATFDGSLQGWDYHSLDGEGVATLAPDPEGEIRMRVSEETIHFESQRLATRGVELSIEGNFDGVIDARYRARARLSELHDAARGVLAAEGTVSGPLDALRADASIRSESLRVEDTPLALDGNVAWFDSRLHLRSVNLSHESGARAVLDGVVSESLDLTGHATYHRDDPEVAVTADLTVTGSLDTPLIEGRLGANVGEGHFVGSGRLEPTSRRITLSGESSGIDITQVPELAGRLEDLRFDVEGTLDAPLIQANALLTGLSYRGVALPEMLVSGESDGEALVLDAGQTFTSTVALQSPYATHATISLDALPLTELVRTFPDTAETELRVSGDAVVDLPLTDPAAIRYRVEATSALGFYRGVVLGASAPFTIEGDLDGFRISELDLIGADTAVALEGLVPLSRAGQLSLDARGALRLDLLNLWFPETELSGRANVTLHVGGALDDPQWTGDAVIDDIRASVGKTALVAGRLELEGQKNPLQPVSLRFRAEDVVAKSESGEVELSLSGEVSGASESLSALEGSGRLESVVVRGGGLEVASSGPAGWRLVDGLLALETLQFDKEQMSLSVSGQVRPFGEALEWDATLDGTVNHALLNPSLSDLGLIYSGTTELHVRATQRNDGLVVEGGGAWKDARLTVQDPPLVFTNVTGAFELDGSTVTLTTLTADAGGGRIAAEGTVELAGTDLADVNLTATASSVRLSYPEGLRSEIDGSVRLAGGGERLRLSGEIDLKRAVFSRNIDIETELLQSIDDVAGLSEPGSFAESVQVDIRIRAADGLRIDNNLARMESTANLTLAGTLGSPELRGIVSSRPGGRFRFGRNDYVVESGSIQLNGYPAEPADVDIQARTSVRSYNLRLSLRGTTDNLVTDLSAPDNPELSRGDVASLLVTGRTLETVSSESRAILGEQMASYLGSTLGDLAQIGLGNLLPFQIVTVEPALISQETDPSARFTLGAALTDSLTMVYSIGLDDAENQIWIIDYELARRARTQLIRRQDNEFSIGLTQELQYDPRTRDQGEGRRVTVSSVDIEYLDDEPPESAPEILRKLRPKVGDRWDYWKAWEEAERIRMQLREEGYLEATVDVGSSSCGEGCIDVSYEVFLGVPVAFLWRGDPVEDSLLDAVKGAWNGQLGEGFVATDLATLAEGKLFEKKYYLAQVTTSTQRTDQGLTVTVDFSRGPRGKDVAVEFTGNEALAAGVLREALPKRSTAAFFELLTTKRPRLKQLLELRYASHGYLTATIGDPDRHFDAGTGRLLVTIPVSEGELFRADGIELQGVESFEPETLRARLPLRAGAIFRPADFVQSRATLASYYRQQGFPDVAVTASLLEHREEGRIGVRYVVNEGRPATVGNVTVAGNDSTNDDVILREVAFKPGETLKVSEVNETQKRLYELQTFRSAEVVVGEPDDGDTRRDVTIQVRETAPLSFDYGLRVATDGLFEVVTEVGAANLFGRAHHASLRTLVATDQRIFRFTYHTPYFARYKLDTDFFVERETRSDVNNLRSWKFTAQQTRPLRENLNVQWSYTFQREVFETFDFIPIVFTQNRGIVSGSLIGDTRDSILRPTKGSLWSVLFQAAPSVLGSSSNRELVKLFSQYYAFVPLGDGVVWASGVRVGVANSFGQLLVEQDRFQAGGPNSVRGYEQGSLGLNDPILRIRGGAALVVLNQEIRFPLVWKLRGAGFWDAGNTYETVSEMSLSDLRHALGGGIRLEVPFGIVRLDLARALDPRPGEASWRFVFSLGHAF